MHKTTLEQWRMFRAVVENGGFNQAAEAIHKSPSTIHHAVRKLEESIGTRLLEVQTRKAQLTQHGKILFQRSQKLLSDFQSMERIATASSDDQAAPLLIGLHPAYPLELITPYLQTLHNKGQLSIRVMTCSEAANALELSQLDLYLSPSMIGGTDAYSIDAIPYCLVGGTQTSVSSYTKSPDVRHIRFTSELPRNLFAWESGPQDHWTVEDMATSSTLIQSGAGIGWLPESSIQNELVSGKLKVLKHAALHRYEMPFFCLIPEGKKPSREAQGLIQALIRVEAVA